MSTRLIDKGLPAGFILADNFRVESLLGQGGFGTTYLATDIQLDCPVAIKEYNPSFAIRRSDFTITPATESNRENYSWGFESFLKEAQLLAKFQHPNIVKVRHIFRANDTAYIVMDYEQGVSLLERLDTDGLFTTDQDVFDVLLPIANGLKSVHKRDFLHRDIKPHNLFIRSDGSPLLLDFGSARIQGMEATCTVHPGYTPIEQFEEGNREGAYTDIYSLGAAIYHSIKGRAPPSALTRQTEIIMGGSDPYVPLTTDDISGLHASSLVDSLNHALQQAPENRPQSLDEWQQQFGIQPEATAKLITARPDSTQEIYPELKRKSGNRRPLRMIAAGFIAACAIGLLTLQATDDQPGITASSATANDDELLKPTLAGDTQPVSDDASQPTISQADTNTHHTTTIVPLAKLQNTSVDHPDTDKLHEPEPETPSSSLTLSATLATDPALQPQPLHDEHDNESDILQIPTVQESDATSAILTAQRETDDTVTNMPPRHIQLNADNTPPDTKPTQTHTTPAAANEHTAFDNTLAFLESDVSTVPVSTGALETRGKTEALPIVDSDTTADKQAIKPTDTKADAEPAMLSVIAHEPQRQPPVTTPQQPALTATDNDGKKPINVPDVKTRPEGGFADRMKQVESFKVKLSNDRDNHGGRGRVVQLSEGLQMLERMANDVEPAWLSSQYHDLLEEMLSAPGYTIATNPAGTGTALDVVRSAAAGRPGDEFVGSASQAIAATYSRLVRYSRHPDTQQRNLKNWRNTTLELRQLLATGDKRVIELLSNDQQIISGFYQQYASVKNKSAQTFVREWRSYLESLDLAENPWLQTAWKQHEKAERYATTCNGTINFVFRYEKAAGFGNKLATYRFPADYHSKLHRLIDDLDSFCSIKCVDIWGKSTRLRKDIINRMKDNDINPKHIRQMSAGVSLPYESVQIYATDSACS